MEESLVNNINEHGLSKSNKVLVKNFQIQRVKKY